MPPDSLTAGRRRRQLRRSLRRHLRNAVAETRYLRLVWREFRWTILAAVVVWTAATTALHFGYPVGPGEEPMAWSRAAYYVFMMTAFGASPEYHEAAPLWVKAAYFALPLLGLFVLIDAFVRFTGLGYAVVGQVDPNGVSNPTRAEVVRQAGGWLRNYGQYPWMWIAPAIGFLGPVLALIALKTRRDLLAFLASSLTIFGVIGTVGFSMFPIILPSSVDKHSSLLVWTASSSPMTLFIMLLVTAVLLPLVLYYTAWVYKVLFGRIGVGDVAANPDLY